MKLKKVSIIRISIVLIGIILFTLAFSGCSVGAPTKQDYLMDTEWDQMNLYAKFCPDNNRAGCWSTAIAQILYFHRMMPAGKVDYETTTGYKISEDLDSYEFNWDLFVSRIDDKTSEKSVDQVAKYIYYTSLVLEKDFNTGLYKTIMNEYKDGAYTLNVDNAIVNLDSHFNCKAMDYHYTKEELEAYKDDIEKLIKEDIDSSRPIMIYMEAKNNGHAAVIDGYSYVDNKFMVHINQGAGGYGNEWYDFNKPFADELDDMNHRVLITIKPPMKNTK